MTGDLLLRVVAGDVPPDAQVDLLGFRMDAFCIQFRTALAAAHDAVVPVLDLLPDLFDHFPVGREGLGIEVFVVGGILDVLAVPTGAEPVELAPDGLFEQAELRFGIVRLRVVGFDRACLPADLCQKLLAFLTRERPVVIADELHDLTFTAIAQSHQDRLAYHFGGFLVLPDRCRSPTDDFAGRHVRYHDDIEAH